MTKKNNHLASPDGKHIWDGKRWTKAPKGTIHSFLWSGDSWVPIPPTMGGLIFSPDQSLVWTGEAWIKAPPNVDEATNGKALSEGNGFHSRSGSFGNHNFETKKVSNSSAVVSLTTLAFTFFVGITLFSTQAIQPLLYDASLVRTGRYAMTFDAWETIGEDQEISVVGIGSSMLQYSLNGSCVENRIGNDDVSVYNLAIPGSMPYMEMIQTEAAIRAEPDVILLELGPNSLWDVDEFSNEGLMDYFELRLTILTLTMASGDRGGWLDILRDSELDLLDEPLINKYRSESSYANEAIEESLRRVLLDESSAPREVSAAYVPHPSDDSWPNYLRTQNWLYSKLELMDEEQRKAWENETIPNSLKKGVNNPRSNGTLNHEALDYMVSEFTNSGVKVILVSPPLHPLLVENLGHEQYSGHNTTMESFSDMEGVYLLNLIWDDYWEDDDFFDHNHLDRHGRDTFCERVTPFISQVIGD